MVHRVLQEVLTENIKPDKKLEERCKHSSERERAQWKLNVPLTSTSR
jgi:ribonuclease R